MNHLKVIVNNYTDKDKKKIEISKDLETEIKQSVKREKNKKKKEACKD